MTSVIRMMSAFFLTLLVGLIISLLNGLDLVRAVQGSLSLAWITTIIVLSISLLIERVDAIRARFRH